MKNIIIKVVSLAFLLSAGASSAATLVFSDGFENSTVGQKPGTNDPSTGTYNVPGTGVGNIVRTGTSTGGPAAAQSGSNYLELSRTLGTPDTAAVFAGSAVTGTSTSIDASFYFYSDGAFPTFSLTNSNAFGAAISLVHFGVDAGGVLKAYDGSSYQTIGGSGTVPTGQWNKIDISWDPDISLTQATISINNGTAINAPLYGAVPTTVDRLWFSSGSSGTEYWVDTISITTVPEPSTAVLLLGAGAGMLLRRRRRT